jgi:tRNA (guanine37-N1)-methyltransferase
MADPPPHETPDSSPSEPLRIDVITLFPGMFPGPLAGSIPGRALERGLATLDVHDLRQWGLGRHRSVDDYPYGGGAGMVLRPEPIAAAVDAVAPAGSSAFRILLDPGGERFEQARAIDLASRPHLVLVCPRYEGVDDRVRALMDLELSIGDYVVSGGEIPALAVIDAVLRLLPGAIDAASTEEESFAQGLLEYPQYTRPPVFRGAAVPEILLSGHHAAVAAWRHEQAVERTRRVRPDLLAETPTSGVARETPTSGVASGTPMSGEPREAPTRE